MGGKDHAFIPYVPATESPAEFTFKAVLLGMVFGVVFGAANACLGLVGATPRSQQIGEMIGVLNSAFFVCLTVKFN